ncbi:peptidase C1B, bleomycin hydrolase [Jimgerdemannia flammicorona]|uniref:Cysteine proteinase 1, mitochondrial n=1 Tax=Jimgerdemannia flammicorona TaxID=994334 RepID=A0A433C9S8_9FUNG|nr:peptidase C1B, bleomycin hydrolase [Jimgerdemannia flammicorona]
MGARHSTLRPTTPIEKQRDLLSQHSPPPYVYSPTTSSEEAQSRAQHGPLTDASVERFRREFRSDSKNLLALNAITRADPASVCMSRDTSVHDLHVFNIKLEVEGRATNQKASGRCWLFAGTNVLRLRVMNKYKLEDFELSQPYLFFWDKLEKANFFLENMIDLADRDINDRVLNYLLSNPVNDGGQWDMSCSYIWYTYAHALRIHSTPIQFVNLVTKYGLVPKSAYPESFSSSASSRLNWLVTVKLREFATQLRALYAAGAGGPHLRAQKEAMMAEIYRVIVIALGEPPKSFDWATRDKNGKYIEVKAVTPKRFAEEVVGYPITETLSLINDPRNDYSRLYTVDRLGNVAGGNPVRYVNTDVGGMKKLALAALRAGKPVWFGADVGKFSDRASGILDTKLYDYELGFGVTLGMSKAQRLLYGESLMTHAMVFSGVHVDEDGRPVRWRVENSWGEEGGEKGYWVVLEKRDVTKELVKVLEQEPIVLPAYDPMGALA